MINIHKTTDVLTVKFFILLGYCACHWMSVVKHFKPACLPQNVWQLTPSAREQYSRTKILKASLQKPKYLS